LIQKVFNKSNSSFSAPRPGHNILWEMLSQTLTYLEKQWVLAQAAAAGDNYHLDKCGLTGLSQFGPEKEEREGEESQRHWIPKRVPQSPIQTGDQAMPMYDPKWEPENDKDEWTITTSSTAFLRV
jgi:hypothetical protein